MLKTIGVVVDPLSQLHAKKDSTLLLMQAALERGYRVLTWQAEDMSAINGRVQASVVSVTSINFNQSPVCECGDSNVIHLDQCDLILFRKDPPFNMAYIYATYFLEMLEKQGVRVVNRPASVRGFNEKLSILQFPDAITDTVVTADVEVVKAFHQQHEDIIVKPLDGMGGSGIYRLPKHDPNVSVIVDQLSSGGQLPLMVQRYLPEIKQGDHRVLLLNGEPMPYVVARLAKQGETRANLAAGGHAEVRPISDRQKALAEMIGPTCRDLGLVIVGLDVIGDYVTEINVTCPTCMRELVSDTGINYADAFFDSFATLA